jgi:hypothetical protein
MRIVSVCVSTLFGTLLAITGAQAASATPCRT